MTFADEFDKMIARGGGMADEFGEQIEAEARPAQATSFADEFDSQISGDGLTGDPNIDPNNLERALGGFIQDKPVLQGVLGGIAAPASAVANVLQGEFGRAGENMADFGRAISPFHEQTYQNRSSFKDVLTNTLGIEGNLGEFDVPLIGRVTGKGALGLVGDIATDPMRFGGLAKLTGKGAQLAKTGKLRSTFVPTPGQLAAGLKPMSNLGAQAAAGQRALFGVRAPFSSTFVPLIKGQRALDMIGKTRDAITGSQLGRAFSTKTGVPEMGGTIREAGLSGRAATQGPLENAYWSVRRQMEESIKAGGGDFDAWKQAMVDIAERKRSSADVVPLDKATAAAVDARIRGLAGKFNKKLGEFDRISPAERARALAFMQDNPHLIDDPFGVHTALMATRVNRVMDDTLKGDLASGVDIAVLDDPELNYWFRMVKPEARKALSDRALAESFRDHLKTVLSSSPKARKKAWRGKPRAEINAWWRKQGFKDDLFETDPDILVDARLGQTGRYAESAQSVLKTFEIFGRRGDEALIDANWVRADVVAKGAGLPNLDLGAQAGKMIPNGIAQELQNVLRRSRGLEAPGMLLRLVDDSMSMFKSGVTSLFPQFHSRNFVSNVWANFLGGVDDVRVYGTSARILKDLRKMGKEGGDGGQWTIGGRTLNTRQLVEEMNQHRAFGFGAMSEAELGRFTTTKAGERAVVGALKSPFRLGRKFGETVENHSKIAHYIDKLNKGFSPEEAASSVKKYLFDYGDLTDFEKNVMKRVVPFYTFFRKNLPLQLESMLTNPGRVATAAHVQRALQARTDGEAGPMDTKFVPEWMRRRIYGVKQGEDGNVATISGIGIGLEELAIFDKPLPELLSMLRPELKGAMQAGTERDLFRDLPLSQSDSAYSSFRHLEHIPGGKAFLNWMDFRAVDESKGRYRANPKILNFIMSMPAVGSTSRAMNVMSNLDRATAPGATPTQLGETAVRFFTGLREENITPADQSRRNMYAMLRARQDYLREQVLKGAAREIPVFIPRKELGVEDARSKQVREANAEIRKILEALKSLDATEQSELGQGTLRTGGR